MLNVIIKKEIFGTILDVRFIVATLIFLVLIPLGFYASRKGYEQKLTDYQKTKQTYRQHYEKKIAFGLEVQGYRQPSLLSVFASGLERFLPDQVTTARSGLFRMKKDSAIENPHALLFGEVDFLFNVSFVVSLMALILTFNSISGEKEMGTLRQMISNSVPRSQILLGKIVGNYIVLLIPLVISFLIALIILNASPYISILSSRFLPFAIIIILLTLLFVFIMVSLGVLISSLTHTAITSIMTSLFVWIILAFALPKVSPMIAEIIYPVESPNVITLRKQIAKDELDTKYRHERRNLFDKCMTDFGVGGKDTAENARSNAYAQYDSQAAILDEKYANRFADFIRKIEDDYQNRKSVQHSIAMNLSRMSPISCYMYLISGLSGTGVKEPTNLVENAKRFQDNVKTSIYDNIILRMYGGAGEHVSAKTTYAKGFNPANVSIPEMHYRYATLAELLKIGTLDTLLLCLFSFLFFVTAFLSLRKYDVR
jgi:ABC-type transport system involved in multi-copper enzyme maturation permease subunit